jgi:DNA polymerase III delta prime subunit
MYCDISVEDTIIQDELLEYAGWKLYKLNKFPKRCIFDELLKNDDENLTILKEDIKFKLGEGKYIIPIGDDDGNMEIELELVYSEKIYSLPHNLIHYKWLNIRGNNDDIKTFILESEKYKKIQDKNYVRVYGPSQKGYWEYLFKNPKRDVNTVFIGGKKEILNDLDKFLESEKDYLIFGHPYKRNYLFYGPPGNGKTSFINAIAGKYNLNIYLISFSNVITDEVFKKLISGLNKNSLLVMEDVDGLFNPNERKNLTMSTVLNSLDGLARKNRVICVMTTNHFEVLSDIFKRPGRLDMIIEFEKANRGCFEEMAVFMNVYKLNKSGGDGDGSSGGGSSSGSDDNCEEIKKMATNFYDNICYLNPSRALVQKFLFENREKKIEEIFSFGMVKKFREMNDLFENTKTEVISLYS